MKIGVFPNIYMSLFFYSLMCFQSLLQNCHLLLTDGWYAVKTIIDTPLAVQVDYGKICIGTKLCLSGGELVGSQDACSPLEVQWCHVLIFVTVILIISAVTKV